MIRLHLQHVLLRAVGILVSREPIPSIIGPPRFVTAVQRRVIGTSDNIVLPILLGHIAPFFQLGKMVSDRSAIPAQGFAMSLIVR